MPGVPSLPWVPRGWGRGRGPGVDGLPPPGWLQEGAVWAGEPAFWPGPFPGGPPSRGLLGAQRQARGPLSQPCAGHLEGRGVAGGRHVCRGRARRACVCPCAHLLTRGSFRAEVLWVKIVAGLEVSVCCRLGGVRLWRWPFRSATGPWAGHKPSPFSVRVPACHPGGQVSGWLLGAATWAVQCHPEGPGVPPVSPV